MTEERIVRAETPEGNTHTSTTIITDRPDPDSGISVWFVMFAVLLAVLIGIWAFASMNGQEVAPEDPIGQASEQLNAAAGAVGEAAEDVSDAAGDVGEAAEDVGAAAADSAETMVAPVEEAAPADNEG
jgi:hypothetical protein